MSNRYPVNAPRCHSNTGLLCRRRARSEIVFLVTTSVTTLFHNRYDKHSNYTESRRLYMTAQAPYVPTTSGQCYNDAIKTPTSYDAEEPDRKQYPQSPQASQLFSITATTTTGITQKVSVFTRQLSRRMSHRLPVNGYRCHSNTAHPLTPNEPDRK
jgi:hypothetical protein